MKPENIEELAADWGANYKPAEYNLEPEQYAVHGYAEGYRAALASRRDFRTLQARAILSEWAQKQGHAKCWNHNEILARLCTLFAVWVNESELLPSRADFALGCEAYQDFIYGKEHKGGHLVGDCIAHGGLPRDTALISIGKLAQILCDYGTGLPEGGDTTQEWIELLTREFPNCVPTAGDYWERGRSVGEVDPSVSIEILTQGRTEFDEKFAIENNLRLMHVFDSLGNEYDPRLIYVNTETGGYIRFQRNADDTTVIDPDSGRLLLEQGQISNPPLRLVWERREKEEA